MNIALGDNEGSVPILLRAAALRREHSLDSKPYWNAPPETLRAAEERAPETAARMRKAENEKKRRVPFLRAGVVAKRMEEADELVGPI